MRRTLFLTLLAALAVPATAAALKLAPGDGTLSVRNGEGFVSLNLRGAVIGKIGAGTLEIDIAENEECASLSVFGEERKGERLKLVDLNVVRTVCVFGGTDIRFRLVSGHQILRIRKAREVGVSAVGKGFVVLKGAGGLQDGQYALNGEDYASLPDELERFQLAAPTTPAE
ncbi:MAG: hypothetical protein ACRDN6_10385 [Gaiellaceae bacterium]